MGGEFATIGVGLQLLGLTEFKSSLDAALTHARNYAGAMIASSVTQINSAAKLADRLGEDVQAIRSLEYAAVRSGASMQQMDTIMQRLTLSLGQADLGGQRASQAFKKFGIDVREFTKLGPVEQVTQLASVLAKLKTPAEQTAAAVALIGSRGAQQIGPLMTLLRQTNFTIKDLRAEYDRLHGVIGREDAAGVEMLWESWKKVQTVVDGIFDKLTSKIAPVISTVIDTLLENFDAKNMDQFWQNIFDGAWTALDKTISMVKDLKVEFATWRAAAAVSPGMFRADATRFKDGLMELTGARTPEEFGIRPTVKAGRFGAHGLTPNPLAQGVKFSPELLFINATLGAWENRYIPQHILPNSYRTDFLSILTSASLGALRGGHSPSSAGSFAPSGADAIDLGVTKPHDFEAPGWGLKNQLTIDMKTRALQEESRRANNAREAILARTSGPTFQGPAGLAEGISKYGGMFSGIGKGLQNAQQVASPVYDEGANQKLEEIVKQGKGPPRAG